MASPETRPTAMRPRPQASVECSASAAVKACAGARREGLVGLRPDLAATVTTDRISSHTSNSGPPILEAMRGRVRPPLPRESGLHDDGDDHGAATGALGDEAAGRLADVALERLDVYGLGRRRECLVQRLADLFRALLEQVLGFGGVHPPTSDDLGTGDDRSR